MKRILGYIVVVSTLVLAGCNPNTNYWTVDMRADTGGTTGPATNIFIIEANGSSITTSKKSDANGDFDIPITDIIKEILPVTPVTLLKKSNNEDVVVPVKTKPPITGENIERGDYHGRTNGDRPTWYFNKDMKDYPEMFSVSVEKCGAPVEVTNNGVRFDQRGYLVKQSDVAGRGMAVLWPATCQSTEAHIVY